MLSIIFLYIIYDFNNCLEFEYSRECDATQVCQHTESRYTPYACCVILRTMSRNQCRESRFQSEDPARIHMSRREIKSSARETAIRESHATWILLCVYRVWTSVAAVAACVAVPCRCHHSCIVVVDSVWARLVKMAWTDRALLRLSSLVAGTAARRDCVHATSLSVYFFLYECAFYVCTLISTFSVLWVTWIMRTECPQAVTVVSAIITQRGCLSGNSSRYFCKWLLRIWYQVRVKEKGREKQHTLIKCAIDGRNDEHEAGAQWWTL